MNDSASILDLIEGVPRREKPTFQAADELGVKQSVFSPYNEPDVSTIAPHVWEAHEAAKRRLTQHGTATAEITFKPEIGAFELVAESRDVMDLLRNLGVGAKITIHF